MSGGTSPRASPSSRTRRCRAFAGSCPKPWADRIGPDRWGNWWNRRERGVRPVRHTSSCTCTCTVVQVGSVKTAKWKSCFRRATTTKKKGMGLTGLGFPLPKAGLPEHGRLPRSSKCACTTGFARRHTVVRAL